METNVENIKIRLNKVRDKVEINYGFENFIIYTSIEPQELIKIIKRNIIIVREYYNNKKGDSIINQINLDILYLKIVLYYLSTYIFWKKEYPKEKNRDLIFIEKDFNKPSTNDIIINYLRNEYPTKFIKLCSILLDKSIDETEIYIKNRLDFQNM
jgi:hypothetical protein